jgi:hypothetical protein
MRSTIPFHRLCLALTVVSSAAVAADATERLIVVQPGFPGSTEDGKPFMARLARYLGPRVGADRLEATYHNEPEKALADLRERPARMGIVSVGFYLEQRRTLGLEAVLELEPEGRYRLVVPADAATDLEALRGATVVGGPLYEKDFIGRVVFRGVAARDTWKLEPTLQISRALRQVRRGRYAAAVITEREFGALAPGGKLEAWRELARSDPFPAALLVVIRSPSGSAESARPAAGGPDTVDVELWKRGFAAMAEDKEGKEILDTMGCGGSRPVRVEWLKEVEKKFDAKE